MKSLDEQIKCADREIKMRERVYGRWVTERKMTAENATHEIECMKCIAKTLREVKDKEGMLL